ncbi:MAG: hypothetical protein E6R04_04630 [Spirochaetes bacterium]|nr:MAG: hypothetical protein E6R04_04630 [Spirochaetota bacterium]
MGFFSKRPTKDPYLFDMRTRTGWGNTLRFLRPGESLDIVGHLSAPKIQKGDEFLSAMQSGKVGRFKVTKVEYERDPWDMFFGESEFLRYEDEPVEWERG